MSEARIMGSALAVTIDDELEPVCLVCAEQIANIDGLPRMFWLVNRPHLVDEATLCACGLRMGSNQALQAAERISALIKGPGGYKLAS